MMEWIHYTERLPENEDEVIALTAEGDLPTVCTVSCLFVLDENDKPTKEREWYHSGCECCYGHEKIRVNRWMPIPSIKDN